MSMKFKSEREAALYQKRNPHVQMFTVAEMENILGEVPDGQPVTPKSAHRVATPSPASTEPRTASEEMSDSIDRWITEEFVKKGYPAETQKVTPKAAAQEAKKSVAKHRAEMVEAGTSVLLGGIFSIMLVLWVPIVVVMIIIGLFTAPMFMIPSLVLIWFFGGLRGTKKTA